MLTFLEFCEIMQFSQQCWVLSELALLAKRNPMKLLTNEEPKIRLKRGKTLYFEVSMKHPLVPHVIQAQSNYLVSH